MTYRNRQLTQLARHLPCVNCGADDGTIVWAHSNLPEHGKGMGIKAHDAAGMALCSRCHAELDNGKGMTREERRAVTMKCISKTYMALFERGLVKVA